jgi:hypothetical protein
MFLEFVEKICVVWKPDMLFMFGSEKKLVNFLFCFSVIIKTYYSFNYEPFRTLTTPVSWVWLGETEIFTICLRFHWYQCCPHCQCSHRYQCYPLSRKLHNTDPTILTSIISVWIYHFVHFGLCVCVCVCVYFE